MSRFTRARGEDGATLVEFALIVPVLLLLVFGIIEYGVAFNASSNVNQSARAGGRAAAILSTDPELEFNAAAAAAVGLSIDPSSIQGTPQVCVGPVLGTDTNPCDNPNTEILSLVHQGTANAPLWAIQAPGYQPGQIPTTPDAWPLASRHYGCAANGGTFDKVAVRVSVQHKLIIPALFSKFVGNTSTPTLSATAIFQLEPVPSSAC
jgi:Flp pilus assembly protein TadG